MKRLTPLRLLLATVMTATLALVMQPATPAAAVDVYTEEGRHSVNGREWLTKCDPYSSTVERCRTEILATQVTYEDGRYVQTTDWVFNNLTYLPSPRKTWAGNPLGENGSWTSADGRQWRTECDTPTTGRNGCRSYIYATTIGVVSENPRTYGRINQWMFNNIVQFSVAPPPPPPPSKCSNLPIPAGYKVSTVDGKKIPHLIKTPYTPNTRYNPTSIAQFTRTILRNTALKSQDPVKWDCLFDLATTALMEGSETETYRGKTVRWFPYMFEFDATGTDEIPALEPGWKSGLAQGALLGLMAELASSTGDSSWLNVGGQILNSFEVPLDAGGFLHRDEGFLWFEEYPTETPTTVLNGHLEAIIGLDLWARNTGTERGARARELFNEAIPVLEGVLPLQEVEVEGGTLTSYDLVRGYPAAPLRLTKVPGKNLRLDRAQLNGVGVDLPVTNATTTTPPRLLEPFFNVRTGGRVANEWRSIAAPSSMVTERNGTVTIRSDKNGWQGIHQIIPSSRFEASKPLTMTLDANLTLSEGKGLSGRVAVYQQCGRDKKDVSLLYETQKTRGREWDTYTMGFNAPPAGCDMLVQLLHSSYGITGTTVQYRDIELRQADAVGKALKPGDHQVDDLSVREAPTLALSLTGSGTGQLEAYSGGQWQEFGEEVTLTRSATNIEVPERYAGRNLHYGYHETHVLELLSLYERAYKAGFTASEARFLWEYAARWEPMAPARHGSIPPPIKDRAQARTPQRQPAPDSYERPLEDGTQSWTSDLDSYELPLVDPFELLLEE